MRTIAFRDFRSQLGPPSTLEIGIATLLMLVATPIHAASLADFGYESMQNPSGVLAKSNPGPAVWGSAPLVRPLLVVTAQFQGNATLIHTADQFNQMVFGGNANPNLADYDLANSNGRFTWGKAQSVPLALGPADLGVDPRTTNSIGGYNWRNFFLQAIQKKGFSFIQFDKNHDGQITPDELGILVIHSNVAGGESGGQTDSSNCLGSVCVSISDVGDHSDLATMTHETTHQLGAIDVYGSWTADACLANALSVMGCTGSDNYNTFQLDPWHKIMLGWDEAQIQPFSAYGTATLQAADERISSAPLILYDPNHGTSEYFILEFRSNAYQAKSLYDASIPGVGLAIWHVKLGTNYLPVMTPTLQQYDPNGYQTDTELAIFVDGQPQLIRASTSGELWGVGQQTPALKWLDGTQTNIAVTLTSITDAGSAAVVSWGTPSTMPPVCQFSTACPFYQNQPPQYTLTCPRPVDFYSWSGTPVNATTPPPSGLILLSSNATVSSDTTTSNAVFVAACNSGTQNQCTSYSIDVPATDWCHSHGLPPPPPPPPPTNCLACREAGGRCVPVGGRLTCVGTLR